jgi:GntR family trehalose operon transcriptional repressor
MQQKKYEEIYASLKADIEKGRPAVGKLLPSESALVSRYGCARNTVRRAIALLTADGFLQSRHGKGVFVIYEAREKPGIMLNGIESLKEFAQRTGCRVHTEVLAFDEIVCDAELSTRSLFATGTPLLSIVRVRYLDGCAQIIDHNFFLKSHAAGITREIAESSIYEYLEHETGLVIVTRKQKVFVSPADKLDKRYLSLGHLNCIAALSHQVYDSNGTMFEYTESRHNPASFVFYNTARRVP